jgi:hypothetical protein
MRYSVALLIPAKIGSAGVVPVKKFLGLPGRFSGTMKGYGCLSGPSDCVEIATQ